MANFKIWEPQGWVLIEILGAKFPKAHPYAKSGRIKINRLAYVPVNWPNRLGLGQFGKAKKHCSLAIDAPSSFKTVSR